MQKGAITMDIFLLMNLAQSFGGRVCCCLLAGRGKPRKRRHFHLIWRLGVAASLQRAGLCIPHVVGRRASWAGGGCSQPEPGRLSPGGAGSKGLRDHTRACQSQSTGEHAVGFWSQVRTRAGASQGFALVLDGDVLPERAYGRYPHGIRGASCGLRLHIWQVRKE